MVGELEPPLPPVWQPVSPESRVKMESTGNAQIGIEARWYERLIFCTPDGFTRPLKAAVVERLANRCLKSGRCISDVYPDWIIACTDAIGLGCLVDTPQENSS